jgi:hypothetical protein
MNAKHRGDESSDARLVRWLVRLRWTGIWGLVLGAVVMVGMAISLMPMLLRAFFFAVGLFTASWILAGLRGHK